MDEFVAILAAGITLSTEEVNRESIIDLTGPPLGRPKSDVELQHKDSEQTIVKKERLAQLPLAPGFLKGGQEKDVANLLSNVDPDLIKQIQNIRKLAGTTVIADHGWEEELSDEQVYEKEPSIDWDGDISYGGSDSYSSFLDLNDFDMDLDFDGSAHVDDRGSGEEEEHDAPSPQADSRSGEDSGDTDPDIDRRRLWPKLVQDITAWNSAITREFKFRPDNNDKKMCFFGRWCFTSTDTMALQLAQDLAPNHGILVTSQNISKQGKAGKVGVEFKKGTKYTGWVRPGYRFFRHTNGCHPSDIQAAAAHTASGKLFRFDAFGLQTKNTLLTLSTRHYATKKFKKTLMKLYPNNVVITAHTVRNIKLGNNTWGWQLAIMVGPGNDGIIIHFGVMLFYMETKATYKFALDSLPRSLSLGPGAPLKTTVVFADGLLSQAVVSPGQFFFSDSGTFKDEILAALSAATGESCTRHFEAEIRTLESRDADLAATYIASLMRISRHLAGWGLNDKLTLGLKGSQMSESTHAQVKSWFKNLRLDPLTLINGITDMCSLTLVSRRKKKFNYAMEYGLPFEDKPAKPRKSEPPHIEKCRMWGSRRCTEKFIEEETLSKEYPVHLIPGVRDGPPVYQVFRIELATGPERHQELCSGVYGGARNNGQVQFLKELTEVLGQMFQKLNDTAHGQDIFAAIGKSLLRYSALQRGEEGPPSSLFEDPETVPRQPGGQQIKRMHGPERKQQSKMKKQKVESAAEAAPDEPAAEAAKDEPAAEAVNDEPAAEAVNDEPAAEAAKDVPTDDLDKLAADTSADSVVFYWDLTARGESKEHAGDSTLLYTTHNDQDIPADGKNNLLRESHLQVTHLVISLHHVIPPPPPPLPHRAPAVTNCCQSKDKSTTLIPGCKSANTRFTIGATTQ
ncbi:hypothetical protein SARC_03789 [Sphaeroforma arctica JP610]|uniref:Uncharacterized protein n=1 Tax=Sphaeroforma arctica JP610 TaxID=667725 RepID=A0A0L0G4W7_9EUKA|nr:hypothetical protein SARC_03789 [Sphaeroforma arctica JP610]KNC83969.1 hypothetical protein SARC_03789 [Sphaeroforma arctica JP610]|eukprot:XP_014157871.1 hypothetical protein SARC_03789 [Sphaeroforma arctica JP610]